MQSAITTTFVSPSFNLKGLVEIVQNDSSAKLLLISNIFVIILSLVFSWSLINLMWVYWTQSVIIGIFHFFKFISAGGTKAFFGVFFLIHYGGFHLGYLFFLTVFSLSSFLTGVTRGAHFDINSFLLGGVLFFVSVLPFFISHLYSFLKHKEEIKEESFFDPYVRIFPMHLTIIFGLGFASALSGPYWSIISLLLFGVLKTIADLMGHSIKHNSLS